MTRRKKRKTKLEWQLQSFLRFTQTQKILRDQLKIIKEKYTHFSWQHEQQEMYYKIPIKKKIMIMQSSLLNFYYICWMELNRIKPNPLSLGEAAFIY